MNLKHYILAVAEYDSRIFCVINIKREKKSNQNSINKHHSIFSFVKCTITKLLARLLIYPKPVALHMCDTLLHIQFRDKVKVLLGIGKKSHQGCGEANS